MFEVKQLDPPESAGNTFSIFFQPPLCPVLDWPQTCRSQKLYAFLSFLKYAGLILVKTPLGCRNSKLKAPTAASSDESVLNGVSCAGPGGGGGEGGCCGFLQPAALQAVGLRGLCDTQDPLCFILYPRSHNHCCLAVGLRGPCTVTAVTQAMSCFFHPDMCFILLIPPAYIQHGCGWTSPQPNPLRFSFGEENLACFSASLPCPSPLAPPSFLFYFFFPVTLFFPYFI